MTSNGDRSIPRRTLLTRASGSLVLLGLGAGAFAGTAAATVCPRTPGFWKTHFPGAWHPDVLDDGLSLGGVSYSAEEAHAVLDASPKGDKSIVLGQHLIAYELNTWDLNDTCTLLKRDERAAHRWLRSVGGIGSRARRWTAGGIDGETVKDAFDAFNNGRIDTDCSTACVEWEPTR